uniref:General transcription and DNA repair factor IIH subunit TFB5 n=1 Tax=Arcella intermedia TaxID=1963864 RepID=A0A6B2LVT2_9EUKA
MVKARKGILLSCDASIKTFILKLTEGNEDISLVDLDANHLLLTGDHEQLTFIQNQIQNLLNKNSFNPLQDAQNTTKHAKKKSK